MTTPRRIPDGKRKGPRCRHCGLLFSTHGHGAVDGHLFEPVPEAVEPPAPPPPAVVIPDVNIALIIDEMLAAQSYHTAACISGRTDEAATFGSQRDAAKAALLAAFDLDGCGGGWVQLNDHHWNFIGKNGECLASAWWRGISDGEPPWRWSVLPWASGPGADEAGAKAAAESILRSIARSITGVLGR